MSLAFPRWVLPRMFMFPAQLVIVAAAICFVCAMRTAVVAAPVTFEFTAEVASAFPTNGGTWVPYSVSPGDLIRGSFTFEPAVSGPVYPQSGEMRFELAGNVLETSGFELSVENDELRAIDLSGRIADPNNTPDIDFNETGDNIIATCQSSSALFCGTDAAHSDLVFRPLAVLSGQDSLLSSDDLVADLSLWNAFPLREMSLLFRDTNTQQDIYYIGAYVGRIRAVPEPAAARLLFTLACVLTVWILFSRSLRYWERKGVRNLFLRRGGARLVI